MEDDQAEETQNVILTEEITDVRIIIVEFENYKGKSFFTDHPKLVPIFRSVIKTNGGERAQFHIRRCSALTIHKAQGRVMILFTLILEIVRLLLVGHLLLLVE